MDKIKLSKYSQVLDKYNSLLFVSSVDNTSFTTM